MHFLLAMMKHETNTFSPVPTPLERFARGRGTPPEGQDAVAAYRGTQSALAAFIDIAEKEGATYDIPVAGQAWPSGPVQDDAYNYMTARSPRRLPGKWCIRRSARESAAPPGWPPPRASRWPRCHGNSPRNRAPAGRANAGARAA